RGFAEALENIRRMSEDMRLASGNLQRLAIKLNDESNAVGALLSDEEVAEDLRSTVQNVEQASRKLDENMEALRHNFVFRRSFRRLEKQREKEAASPASSRRND